MEGDEQAQPKYKLVIFDFDGTLADSYPWFLSVYDDLAERFKLPHMERAELEQFRSLDIHDMLKKHEMPLWKVVRMGRYLKKIMNSQIERIPLVSGMQTVLEVMAKLGVKLAIVTSNEEANVRQVLGSKNAALFDHFECRVSIFGKTVKFKKILKSYGIQADQVLSIGDEVRDLKSSHQAGIRFGAVSWGYADAGTLRQATPDEVFTSPLEILDALFASQELNSLEA